MAPSRLQLGSQDLGTGTRTIIAMVAAETLAIPMSMIKVEIGDNAYPPSGPSGGSTTVGGVSSSTRKSTVNALNKLFEAVAPGLGVPANQLEADRRQDPRGRQPGQGHELEAGLPETRRQPDRRNGGEQSPEPRRAEHRRRVGRADGRRLGRHGNRARDA